MTQLPNGLTLIDEGTPGVEESGDDLLTVVNKINNNLRLILTENDNLAGDGIKQVNRRLELVQNTPDIVEVDLSTESSVSLSDLNNNSIIKPLNETGNPKTLILESLSDVKLSYSFWIGYTNQEPLTLRFNGGKFLSDVRNPSFDGEIILHNPSSLKICKLDNVHWMTL